MKKSFFIIFIIVINFRNISPKDVKQNLGINKNKIDNKDENHFNNQMNSTSDKIEIELKEHTPADNIVPENLVEFPKGYIDKIYYKGEYDKCKFIVCIDNTDTLNIAYLRNKKYFIP